MEKINNYIGLAARARRIAVGAQAVETAVRNGSARIVFVDKSSSENSQKKYMDMCRHYRISCYVTVDPCFAAGKPGRKCLAICDAGFAQQIEKNIMSSTHVSGGRG